VIFGIGSNLKFNIMIWIIFYIICTAICCGIILYVKEITFDDVDAAFASCCSLFWPVFLVLFILYGLGHCVRFLLTKIIKTK
jgi:hypothetical protein